MTPDLERYKQILPKLKAWFPPEDHSERELPGTKQIWYFVSWQKIRDRLDEVAPDWTVEYSDPIVIDEECCIRCKLTICGVTREAPGYAPLRLVSNAGKNMARGSPGERATADSFKNASEAHGICRYLDEQADKKTKDEFVRYLHKNGNGRAATHHRNNEAVAQGQPVRSPSKPAAKPFGNGNAPKSGVINDAQRKRFYAIVKTDGKYSDEGAKRLLAAYGFASSTEITQDKYEELCRKAADPDIAAVYNQQSVAAETNDWP